jgi:hypothetical protein
MADRDLDGRGDRADESEPEMLLRREQRFDDIEPTPTVEVEDVDTRVPRSSGQHNWPPCTTRTSRNSPASGAVVE